MSSQLQKRTFEECLPIIDSLIYKRRSRWQLAIISWMDWDDVAQILRIHIFKKWGQFDQDKPLEPWINTIISNQMTNLSRNIYYSNARPCLKCSANEGNDLCSLYEKQCGSCPIFRKWEKSKKSAYDIRLPLPIENHMQEVYNMSSENIDIDFAIKNFHKKMKEILTFIEWKIYDSLYIKHMEESDVIKQINLMTTNVKSKSISNINKIKKSIMIKAQKIKNEIDF